MSIWACFCSTPLAAIIVAGKNNKTLGEPFSSLKEERVWLLRLSEERMLAHGIIDFASKGISSLRNIYSQNEKTYSTIEQIILKEILVT